MLRAPGRAHPLLLGAAIALAPTTADAVVIRHDVDDQEYVVADADYPALVDLLARGDCLGALIHPSYLLTVGTRMADRIRTG